MRYYTQIIPQEIQLLLGWNNPATYADENGWTKVANIAIKAALEMLNTESELFLCKKDPNIKKKKKVK